MKYSDKKLGELVSDVRSANIGVTMVSPNSNFIWEQFLLKISKFSEVVPVAYIKKSKIVFPKTGLFKPKIAVFDYSKDLINELMKASPTGRILIKINKKDQNDKTKLHAVRLLDRQPEELISIFNSWLKARKIQAEPSAILYGLQNKSPDELKNILDFIGLRDGGFISKAALQKEFEKFESSIFRLFDCLLMMNKKGILDEYSELLKDNVPHKILASLLTLTKRTLQAVQAKNANATARQLAKRVKCSDPAARNFLTKVKSPNFNQTVAVTLFNTLVGLTLKLRRTPKGFSLGEYMKLELLMYLCDAGYMGK